MSRPRNTSTASVATTSATGAQMLSIASRMAGSRAGTTDASSIVVPGFAVRSMPAESTGSVSRPRSGTMRVVPPSSMQARTRRHRHPIVALLGVTVLLAACATTVVPSPVRTAGPTLPPGASQPASSPIALDDAITEDGLGFRLDALAAVSTKADGWRSTGSKGYDAAAGYVGTELKAAGWTVSEDTFRMAGFFDDGGSSVAVGAKTFADGDVRPLIYAPPGDVTGPVVAIGWDAAPGTNTKGCQTADYGRLPANAIVLVAPGPCIRRTAIQAAQAAGARAFVAGYSGAAPGMALRATLLSPDGLKIPAVGATKQVGDT